MNELQISFILVSLSKSELFYRARHEAVNLLQKNKTLFFLKIGGGHQKLAAFVKFLGKKKPAMH